MRDVFGMILERMESSPDKLAIWTAEGTFTYDELREYSSRAAASLKRDGLQKGQGITIELPRCKEYIGFMLGAWMLGAFFVPSDSAYPDDRKEFIAKDSGAMIRVTPD